jgi:general secretion pathway protein N
MAGHEMMRKLAIAITVVSVYGGTSASTSAISNDALDADRAGGAQAGPQAFSISANPAAPVQVLVSSPAPAAPASERVLSANPLWAIPLSQLPITRDRPIFSPSRRPPPPAVAPAAVPKVAAVPKPREPERPQLTLVGTVAGDDEGFGIFLDQSTKVVFRLKVGQDHQGWKLRSVQGREATLEKDHQVVPLALPQLSVGQVTIEVPPPPANAGKLLSVTSQPRPDDRSGR